MKKTTLLFIALFIVSINLCFSQTYSLTDSLIAYYQFNGNALDSTSNHNDGTFNDTTYTTDRFGNPKSAIYLNGTSDYVDIKPGKGFKPTTFPVTVCAWVKYIGITDNLGYRSGEVFLNDLEVGGTQAGIILNITGTNNVLALSYCDGGESGSGTRQTKLGNTDLADNKWHFIVGIIRGPQNMEIYIDAKNDSGTYSGTGGPVAYDTSDGGCGRGVPCVSGCNPFTYYKGTLGEIRFYHRELSINEIVSLYNLSPSNSKCAASFTSQSEKDSVSFHNYSSSNVTSSLWNFGDSTTSTNLYANSTFSHHYAKAGSYIVCLMTADSSGTCRDTLCAVVTSCDIKAAFTYSVSNNTVTCTSTSVNATQFHWSFGDSSTDTSNKTVITHSYTSPGNYSITLVVGGDSTFQCTDTTTVSVSISGSSYSLTDSLIAYYQFNGNALDSTSNHNDGTFNDTTYTADRFGNPKNAIYLNGTSDYVDIKPGKDFKPTTFPITVSAWVKYIGITDNLGYRSGEVFLNDLEVGGTQAGIILNITGTNNVLALSYCDGGESGSGTRQTKMGTTDLADNQWHFIVGIIRGPQNMEIYIDAKNDSGTYSGTGGPVAYDNSDGGCGRGVPCVSGCNPFTYYKGTLGEIRFYHRELSFNEIVALYNLSPSNSKCYAYFTGQSEKDSVSFHNYSSPNVASAIWNFGDSTTSNNLYTQATFSHHYANPGDYNVCLITSDSSGTCVDTFCTTVVSCNINAAFTYKVNGNTVTCTSTSVNATQLQWNFGDGSSDNSNQTVIAHTYPFAGNYQISLLVGGDSTFQCSDTTSASVQIIIANPDTLSGIVFDDIAGNGTLNVGDPGLANMQVLLSDGNTIYSYANTDSSGEYYFVVGPGTWQISVSYPGYGVQTLPVNPDYYTVTDTTGQNISSFNFGFHNDLVTISGTVFYDYNDNGVQDPSEPGVPYQLVQVGPNIYYTDANGNYAVILTPGDYTVTYLNYMAGYTVSVPVGASYNINAADTSQIYSGYNFGIWTNPNLKDLAVNISPYTNVAPGFQSWYMISYANFGAQDANATVIMTFDSSFTFYTADGAPNVNNSSYTITWNLGSLAPGEYGYINCWFDVPKYLALGTSIENWVVIEPVAGDQNPSNNFDSLFQVVQGSFDPNEKQVSPPGAILPGQKLNYTIEFQNTGTAPAVNIVVTDTLSPNLNWNTFQMEASSHPYCLQRSGPDVKWTFSDIMLPDSGTSQTGSIGFVKYSISPDSAISNGTPINNFADVYFDFNTPVKTNTTTNDIDISLGIKKTFPLASVTVYPNPMDDYANMVVTGPVNKEYIVTITNPLGQRVKVLQARTGDNLQINKDNMAAGIYLYQITIDGITIGQGKIAIQ